MESSDDYRAVCLFLRIVFKSSDDCLSLNLMTLHARQRRSIKEAEKFVNQYVAVLLLKAHQPGFTQGSVKTGASGQHSQIKKPPDDGWLCKKNRFDCLPDQLHLPAFNLFSVNDQCILIGSGSKGSGFHDGMCFITADRNCSNHSTSCSFRNKDGC